MTRLCLTCRALIAGGTRCATCQRARSRARWHEHGAKLYDGAFVAARKAWRPIVATHGFICARGGEPWPPGSKFDLDHIGGGLRPSCPAHNRANR